MQQLIDPEARDQLDKILSPSERGMLDLLDAGQSVPIDSASKVCAYRIRQALSLLSPQVVMITARGSGYTLRRLEL